jgi:Alpha/beta hydrolase family/RTX calcium-binding nonapeptide repeat (4 copies)
MRHNAALASVVVIDSGVLINYFGHPLGVAYATPLVGEATMASTTRKTFKANVQAENPKPFPPGFLDRMYDFFDRPTRCAILPYYRDIRERGGPDPIGRRQAAALRTRRRPALVVWGEKDPYIPKSVAFEQRRAFPGARVEIIPNAGHWPFVDYPQRVERLVIPFLRRVLGQGGGTSRLAGPGVPRSCAGRRVTLAGTPGSDDLRGTPGDDVIVAGSGADAVAAGGGEDTVCGGSGDDGLVGGPGDDRLVGQSGDDRLAGSSGGDALAGGSGRDRCDGGPGADRTAGCEP